MTRKSGYRFSRTNAFVCPKIMLHKRVMSIVKRIAVAAALLLFAALAPAHADERILRFVSDVNVQTNADGTEVEIGFDVLGVTRDGAPESYATEQLGNGKRVRIGRGDVFVPPGNH